MAYENSNSLLQTLIESETPTTENVRLLLKFISKNSLLESLVLDRATDDHDNKSNVHITINPMQSRATLTAYKTCEGGEGLWKSVNIYSMVSASSDANVINSIFGAAEVRYDGCSASNFYPLEIDFTKDFARTGESLGEGSNGIVHKCIRAGELCAVKRILGKPSETPCAEVEAMIKLLGAKHAVQIHSSWGQRDSAGIVVIYIAMEIFERCLEDYLAARSEVDLIKSTIIFIELMLGVKAMHDAGVIHRDLKPGNILLDSNGHVAVTGFGTCAIKPYPYAEVSFYGNTDIGTQYYSDPVLGSTTVKHGEEVDVYRTGVIYSAMHLLNVSKRRKLIRDIDQKYRFGMKQKT